MWSLLSRLLMRAKGGGPPPPWKRRIGSWMLRRVPGMLTCEAFESFMHDYYEGHLPSSVRSRFDIHMTLCPMCQVAFQDYLRAIELGQRLCEDDDTLPAAMPEEMVGAILLARDTDR
ncbi:MAG: hypothetical protein AAF430_05600 [Myxococcota bacterium]